MLGHWVRFVVVLGLVIGVSAMVLAADPAFKSDGKKSTEKPDKAADQPADKPGEKAASSKKDPVELAFALKKGVTLRPDQQTAFDSMKKDMEPKLREALDKVDKASLPDEKTKAARDVNKVRADITKDIHKILTMPAPQEEPQQPEKKPVRRRR